MDTSFKKVMSPAFIKLMYIFYIMFVKSLGGFRKDEISYFSGFFYNLVPNIKVQKNYKN